METKKIFTFQSLGTEIEIQLVVDQESSSNFDEFFEKISLMYEKAMKTFNRFDQQSELCKLNASLGKFHLVSDWMLDVCKNSLKYNKQTNGIFDPRVIQNLENAGYDRDFKYIEKNKANKKMERISGSLEKDLLIEQKRVQFNRRMDFSGIVKGFVTDRIAEFLKKEGVKNFLIDSGGDMFAFGHDANEKKWYISIEGIDEEKLLLKLSNQAVATSGISRRKWQKKDQKFHHLINFKNPEDFSFETRTVTAIAESTEKADVLAKTIFLDQNNDLAIEKAELAYAILDYNGTIRISKPLKKYV